MAKAKFDLKDNSVVVVIGSGAGGGTLGNELAQHGVKTVILEAGGRHEIQDFSNDEWGMFGQKACQTAKRTCSSQNYCRICTSDRFIMNHQLCRRS